MKNRMKNVMMVVVIALISQSCATIFSGTKYTANIKTTNPNSEIYVNGVKQGVGSVTVRQKRKKEMLIESKNNDVTTTLVVDKSIKWGSQFLNLLNWYSFIPVGTIVDLISGGIWQPDHKNMPSVEKVNNKTFDITVTDVD